MENIIYFLTKRATPMRRSTVLSLPLQLVFPASKHLSSPSLTSLERRERGGEEIERGRGEREERERREERESFRWKRRHEIGGRLRKQQTIS
jgi:hypothetical protein